MPFTQPWIKRKDLTIFDTFAEKYSFWANTLGSSRYDEVLSYLPHRPGVVLDAACGDGLLSLRLADIMDHIVGLDISGSMIALAKKHMVEQGKENVDFLCGDLETLPFREGTFDYVLSIFALHNTRIDVSVPGLRRLVRPGGRMILSYVVTTNPRLDTFPAWQVLCALRNSLKYARSFGLGTMCRLLSFELSPEWIRHRVRSQKFTPQALQKMHSRLLPGCTFKSCRWKVMVIWKVPGMG